MKVLKDKQGNPTIILIHDRVMKSSLDFKIDELDMICEKQRLSDRIKQWILDNHTGISTYEQMGSYINDDSWEVRKVVAEYGDDSIREKLIYEDSWGVRCAIAQYGNDSQRGKLINDSDGWVRYTVARHGNNSLRDKLINDSDWGVIRAGAQFYS